MILIADINPFIKKKYKIPQFSSNHTVSVEDYKVSLDTDLKNIFRVFNTLDSKTSLLTYTGGREGEIYEKLISKEVDNYSLLSIRDSLLEVLEIYDSNRNLSISTIDPRLTNEELNELYSLYDREIESKDYILISENLKSSYRDDIINNFLKIAYKSGIKIGISSKESSIKQIIKHKPYLVVLDKNALEEYSSKEISFIWESNLIIKGLLEEGISKIIYYNNKNEIQLFSEGNIFTISPEERINIFNKDMMLSGYIAAKDRNYDEEMALSIGLAFVKISQSQEVIKEDASIIKKLIKDMKVDKLYVK